MALIIFITLLISVLSQSPVSCIRNKDLEFSDAEKSAVEKLRTLVKDLNYDAWIKADWSLIHYLRVKELDINGAATAVKETIRWRQENKIDQILGEDILKLNPRYYTGSTAKDGSPVIYWLGGRWDVRKILLEGKRDKFVRYFDQLMESGFTRIVKSQAESGNATQWVMVLDLHGYGLSTHACVSCLPMYFEWVSHQEKYYPAVYQHYFLINTPRVFIPLLNILKSLYSAPTRNAMKTLGVDKTEWQAELANLIAPEEMPKILGGKMKNWF